MRSTRHTLLFGLKRTARVWVAAACSCIVALSALGQGGGPPPSPVRVETVNLEEITRMRMVTGELRAIRRAAVATREAGLVLELPVADGQRVSAGDVLVRLDARRVELEIEQANADAQVAASMIDERQAEYDWRQADLDLLNSAQDIANKKEILDAESELAIARARLDQASRALLAIDARLELLKQTQSDKTTVAPFDGIVIRHRCELGEWLDEGAPVVELLSTGAMEAWLRVPQSEFDAIAAESRPITLRFDASGRSVEASDLRVLPDVDAQARTFVLIAEVNDAEGRLAPGMSLVAWVPTAAREERLTIPKDAVQHNDSGDFVYVARGGGDGTPAVAVLVRIDVRFPSGDRYVVDAADLAPGDFVVVEGNERLFPTAPVIAIPRETEPGAGGGRS